MRPVALAAEHPQHHDPGIAQCALDIKIDRGRMTERQQIGQPHAWKILRQRRIGGAECRKIAVGRRQQHDIGAVLPEVAGDLAVVNAAAAIELQMHPRQCPLLPCQSAPCGFSVEPFQADHHQMLGLISIRSRIGKLDTAADGLHHKRRRLVDDAGMAFHPQHAGEVQRAADAGAHRIDVCGRRRRHHDTVEIIVIMLFFLAVVPGARRDIVLGGGVQSDQHGRR